LLELIGAPVAAATLQALPGSSIYDDAMRSRARPFACYFDGYCYGYVLGDRKVTFAKQATRGWYFDLATDPDETTARPLSEEMQATQDDLFSVIDRRRTPDWPYLLGRQEGVYEDWVCPAGEHCHHPNSPEGYFFELK
jgi:hypothetical protein